MSDFSEYTAGQVVDWMSQGTVATPPTNLFVTVFDSSGTELDASFDNARASTTTGPDWDVTNTAFVNADEIDLGEALNDVTDVQDIALYDAETGGNEIARYALTDNPFDVAEGSFLVFEPGEIDFNVIDRTE